MVESTEFTVIVAMLTKYSAVRIMMATVLFVYVFIVFTFVFTVRASSLKSSSSGVNLIRDLHGYGRRDGGKDR